MADDLDNNFQPDLFTLEDENGELTTFELWDTLEENGQVYYALVPVYDDPEKSLSKDAELVVLKAENPDNVDAETLVTIEDDDEYERIGNIFLERLENYFDGEDEDEDYDPEDFDGDDYDGEEA